MKLVGAISVYVLFAIVLSAGIVRAVSLPGFPWLLVLAVGAFVLAFAWFGCLPPRSRPGDSHPR